MTYPFMQEVINISIFMLNTYSHKLRFSLNTSSTHTEVRQKEGKKTMKKTYGVFVCKPIAQPDKDLNILLDYERNER